MYTPEEADTILDLKICEPAMGSGAFLNEAADSARPPLSRSQTAADPGRPSSRAAFWTKLQTGETLHHHPQCLRRGPQPHGRGAGGPLPVAGQHSSSVGTDRATTANRISYRSGATPWFGLRLRCGNSLIGARRAVWTVDQQLRTQKALRYQGGPCLRVCSNPAKRANPDEIYHFLVFDPDMVPTHTDSVMRQQRPEQCGAAKSWINQQVKTQWDQEEVAEALRICDLIDTHWAKYTDQRTSALAATACTATVWPQPSQDATALKESPTLARQEQVRQGVRGHQRQFPAPETAYGCLVCFVVLVYGGS